MMFLSLPFYIETLIHSVFPSYALSFERSTNHCSPLPSFLVWLRKCAAVRDCRRETIIYSSPISLPILAMTQTMANLWVLTRDILKINIFICISWPGWYKSQFYPIFLSHYAKVEVSNYPSKGVCDDESLMFYLLRDDDNDDPPKNFTFPWEIKHCLIRN